MLELAVDAEAADAAEAVAVLVEELLREQRLRLVDLRRVARTQTAVDLEERGLVLGHAREEVELLFGERVEDQRIARVGDDADRSQVRSLDRGDHVADRRADAAEFLAGVAVDDEFGREVLGLELGDLDLLDLVEELEQLVGRRVLLVEGAQERRRRELRRLVDSHRQDVLLGDFELDPRAALRDDARLVERTVAERADDREIHARGAVELAHDAALGAIHDELAAAHHDRDLAEVDLLFGDLAGAFAHEAHADAERTSVGQAQLAAFIRGVAGLIELVVEVLELHRAVVALDGEHFPHEAFEADLVRPLVVALLHLEEALVRVFLNTGKNRNRKRVAALREIPNRLG